MKKRFAVVSVVAVVAVAVAVWSRDDDGERRARTGEGGARTGCDVTPGAWSAPRFAVNAADALALRAQLAALTGTSMRGAEEQRVVVDDVSDLEAVYDGGSPVLSARVHPSFNAVVDDALADFVAAVRVGPRDLFDDDGGAWTPGDHGGVFGARRAGINTGGIELRQLVDKGMLGGGALYGYAMSLTDGAITEATIDAIVAAWGAGAALDKEALAGSANYAHTMGFYAEMARTITGAKAYTADPGCTAKRDAALHAFFRSWEKALFARVVYYAWDSAAGMTLATTDDARADALHSLSEGLGLAVGFHGLPDPSGGPMAGAGRVIKDADIEAILSALGVRVDDLSASTIGAFTADPSAFEAGVGEVESRIEQVYQLDDRAIASFRKPTAG